VDRRLLEVLVCPACEGTLTLAEATVVRVPYADGAREEVERGTVACGCGQRYPVEGFVLSLAGRFPPLLQQEAAFWDRYYLWLLEQGSYGFHDLRRGLAPYITLGVPEPFPAADTIDRYDVHLQVAHHPLLRQGRTLLDIGVGLGWTSLTFAQAGYAVTAFEPSLGPVQAAKRYAMEQGIFIEYLCAALGHIAFRPASFDNVTAFHSLHHVPDLESALRAVSTWLRLGGALAVDEHVGNSALARALGGVIHAWAEKEVLPRYRTVPPDALARLPQEPHSALEDSAVDQVTPLLHRLFAVREERFRHVFLDHYPLLYYLAADRDLAGFRHALAIANQLQEFVRQVDPDGGDYVTIIAENTGEDQGPGAGGQGSGAGDQGSVQAPAAPEPPDPDLRADLAAVQEQIAALSAAQSDGAAAHQRVAELSAQLQTQTTWAQGIEGELRRKDAEIARLQGVLRRLENGRVMRLLRLLRK
jgi:SAM-dependent methyltransferase